MNPRSSTFSPKKIAIIGCGYVGTELAKRIASQGHQITVTTRTPKNLDPLSSIAKKALILRGNDEQEISLLIQKNEVIIVTVAADSPEEYEDTYLTTAKSIRKAALNTPPKTLLYTSSSSVYGDHEGQWVDENSPLLATTEPAKILIETEKTFRSLQDLGWKVSIFRLTEIYGPNRSFSQKIQRLQNHSSSGSGSNYTNMVHLDDIVGAMDYTLTHHLEGTFNLSDDEHPTRKEFYDQLSEKFQLPKVQWSGSSSLFRGNRRVSNHKIKSVGYSFRHPERAIN